MTTAIKPLATLTLGHGDTFEKWIGAHIEEIDATTTHCAGVELVRWLRAAYEAGVEEGRKQR